MNEYRKILMEHREVITVPEIISHLYSSYQTLGYKMSKKIMFAFWYYQEDYSKMIVYWEEGYIYEEAQMIKEEDI